MREAPPPDRAGAEVGSLRACVATVLEIAVADVPVPAATEDPIAGRTISRWLAGLGMGFVHRGGLRADFLEDGILAVADRLSAV